MKSTFFTKVLKEFSFEIDCKYNVAIERFTKISTGERDSLGNILYFNCNSNGEFGIYNKPSHSRYRAAYIRSYFLVGNIIESNGRTIIKAFYIYKPFYKYINIYGALVLFFVLILYTTGAILNHSFNLLYFILLLVALAQPVKLAISTLNEKDRKMSDMEIMKNIVKKAIVQAERWND